MENTIDAYLIMKERIREQQKIISKMRQEEKLLVKNIQQYLNDSGESGIRVDPKTVITITTNPRNIPVSQKKYRAKLETLIAAKGLPTTLVDDILTAKIDNTIQEQKLKLKITK